MKSSKKSAIIESYGKQWDLVKDYVDDNGWVESSKFSHYQNINGMSETPILNIFGGSDGQFIEFEYRKGNKFWRPNILHGIEYNNGWQSVDDENTNAIKDDVNYDLYDAEDDEIMYNVSGIFNVLSLTLLPAITHIRISNNKKPIYR